jgi:acyl-CoA synthetase (AMP-forming)/AMP-acid ligase II
MKVPLLALAAILGLPTLLAEAEPDGLSSEFTRMLAGFGKMETVAGRVLGGIPSGNEACNDWNAAWEGGPATDADLSRPHMAQADAAGNIYIADKEGHAVRKVALDGTITTFAGTGLRGNGGEGVANQTNLREPNGLFTFPDGTTFILEVDDNCETGVILSGGKIRRVAPNGLMTTLIDDPNLGTGRGLWVSPDESLIYYCSGSVLRKWTPQAGIETFSTGYLSLGNIAMGPDGFLMVTNRSNRQIESGHYVIHPDPIAITGALAGHSPVPVNRLFFIGLDCAPKAQISHSSLCHARGSLQSAIGGT